MNKLFLIAVIVLVIILITIQNRHINNIIYGTATIYCDGGKIPLSTSIDKNAMIIYDYGKKEIYSPINGDFSFSFKGSGVISIFFDLEIAGYINVNKPGEYNLSIIDCEGL